MFLGLLDPDPLARGTDPDPGPSIIKQNSKKNFGSYCFVDPYQNGTDPQNCFNRLRKSYAIVPLICVIKTIQENNHTSQCSLILIFLQRSSVTLK
jgi:hypothetical protein